ncbi:hypothetical protein VTK26DRAFT_8405 [Humicola hyalothermophila]
MAILCAIEVCLFRHGTPVECSLPASQRQYRKQGTGHLLLPASDRRRSKLFWAMSKYSGKVLLRDFLRLGHSSTALSAKTLSDGLALGLLTKLGMTHESSGESLPWSTGSRSKECKAVMHLAPALDARTVVPDLEMVSKDEVTMRLESARVAGFAGAKRVCITQDVVKIASLWCRHRMARRPTGHPSQSQPRSRKCYHPSRNPIPSDPPSTARRSQWYCDVGSRTVLHNRSANPLYFDVHPDPLRGTLLASLVMCRGSLPQADARQDKTTTKPRCSSSSDECQETVNLVQCRLRCNGCCDGQEAPVREVCHVTCLSRAPCCKLTPAQRRTKRLLARQLPMPDEAVSDKPDAGLAGGRLKPGGIIQGKQPGFPLTWRSTSPSTGKRVLPLIRQRLGRGRRC